MSSIDFVTNDFQPTSILILDDHRVEGSTKACFGWWQSKKMIELAEGHSGNTIGVPNVSDYWAQIW
jgi:hypothetical protein